MIEFAKRAGKYLTTMFPVQVNIPFSVVLFFGFYFFLDVITDAPFAFSIEIYFGITSVFLSLLMMRTFDELKDENDDKENFPDRPLVTGAVRYADVKIISLISLILLVLLNIDRGIATSYFLVVFAFAVLAWQWWMFEEKVSKSFVLTFITHQTLVPLILAYIAGVYQYINNVSVEFSLLLSGCIIFWLPFIAWEIGRKIRSPEQEDNYLSYTKRWGTRVAPSIVVGLFVIGVVINYLFAHIYEFSSLYQILHVVIASFACVAVMVFIISPQAKFNKVKTILEIYLFLYFLTPVIEWIIYG